MTDPHDPEPDPLAHPEVRQAGVAGYVSGTVLTAFMLLAALVVTGQHRVPATPMLTALSGLTIFVLIGQSLLFFGLDFSRYHIWKTLSLILTIPLFILSIGLTVWMFHSLNNLTMMPDMPSGQMQPTLLQ